MTSAEAHTKTYAGERSSDHICTVFVDGHVLDPRLDLRNHSPTGFKWGYGGSGPAQLALAILADCFGDEVAEKEYQRFKSQVVGRLPESGWILTEAEVRAAVTPELNHEKQEAKA